MPSPREEAAYWENQVTDLKRGELKTVRDAAGKWQTTISGLLGAFAAAAFIKGPSTYKDLGVDQTTSVVLVLLLSIAGLCAVVATFVTASAAIGVPRNHPFLTGVELRLWDIQQTITAEKILARGRRWMIAALVISVGTAIAVPAASVILAAPSPVRAMVRHTDGQLVCGTLENASAIQIRVGGTLRPLAAGDTVEIVDKCPP